MLDQRAKNAGENQRSRFLILIWLREVDLNH